MTLDQLYAQRATAKHYYNAVAYEITFWQGRGQAVARLWDVAGVGLRAQVERARVCFEGIERQIAARLICREHPRHAQLRVDRQPSGAWACFCPDCYDPTEDSAPCAIGYGDSREAALQAYREAVEE